MNAFNVVASDKVQNYQAKTRPSMLYYDRKIECRAFYFLHFLIFLLQVPLHDRRLHVHRRHVHEQLVLRPARNGDRRHHLQVHRVQRVSQSIQASLLHIK